MLRAFSPKFFYSGIRIFLLVSGIYALTACGATHNHRPIGERRSQVYASFGGPLITVGVPIPAPYSVLGYTYGYNDRMNLHAAFHPSAALYKTFAADLGAGYEVLHSHQVWPEIYLDGSLAFGADGSNFVAFPILSPVFSYSVGRLDAYWGSDFLFQFQDNDRVWTPQSISPFVGESTRLGKRWNLGIELKWASINHNFKYASLKHPSALGTDYGALAPYIYCSYSFGGSGD